MIVYVLRNKLHCTRDEILWEMPIWELNMMIHSFYCMEGREVRKPLDRLNLIGKFNRALSLFRHFR